MSDTAEPPKPDFSQGIPLNAIADGGMLAGTVGAEPVLLVRTGGKVRAFGGSCTHLGAPLGEGLCTQGTIRCPWHHARFDAATGEAVGAPAFDPLPAWIVEQTGNRVFVTGPAERRTLPVRTFEGHSEPGIVIIGGGAAGFAAAHALRERGHEGPVTVVSTDTDPPYDRTLLTKDYLDGKFGAERLPICSTGLQALGVTFIGGSRVVAIDRTGRQLELADGRRLPYKRLLLATGAEPNRLDVPGAHLPHVRLLRTLSDCRALLARLTPGTRIVVIGSSFIGLEAAASLRSRGFEVTVVTPEAKPMAKLLGSDLSRAILSIHTRKGVVFRLNGTVTRIDDEAVHLRDGSHVPADLVVVGIGVTPRTELAEEAGLHVDEGVVVDRFMRTSDPDIYAAGDIARWPDGHSGRQIRVEHWMVAERQGQTAARNMMGEEVCFTDVPFFWSKHFDFSFRYVGHTDSWDEANVEGDLDGGKAMVRYFKAGQQLAVATVGDDLTSLEVERTMEFAADLRRV